MHAIIFLVLLLGLEIGAQAAPRRNSIRNAVETRYGEEAFFYKGHDLSSLKVLEDTGSSFRDTAKSNQTRDAEDILGDGGMNTVRLRLWVNPPDGTYNLDYNIDLAKRFSKKGYKIYLDYHFSDTWADPQHNNAPEAWPTDLDGLSDTLRKYVSSTLKSFSDAGIDLSLVSLGNEIRHGMLWPTGHADVDVGPLETVIANFSNLATLYASARQGVNDAVGQGVAKPQVMIHIDNGWNLTLQQQWFGALTAEDKVRPSDWDVFGFSYYPFYDTNATYANLNNSLQTLAATYNKPIQVVETDFPEKCDGTFQPAPELSEPSVPVSVEGQVQWVHAIINIVRQLPNGLGQGVHYWEPAFLNNTSLGSACEDALLFDADYSDPDHTVGYSRSSVNMFK